MKHELDLQTIAEEIKAAQDQCRQVGPLTGRLKDFSNVEAYAVAQLIHEMRVKEGAVPVGRKIGFTNPEMWSVNRHPKLTHYRRPKLTHQWFIGLIPVGPHGGPTGG
jgi:2-keto-4-pentenoate hydratase